jgi:hypothetical protein
MIRFVSAVLMSGLLLGVTSPVDAKPKRAQYQSSASDGDGYTIRRHRGGYSYDYADSINTYGGHRKRQVGPPSFREQTIGGPFDNSFFFDSAMPGNGPRFGGNAPYMH